MRGCARLPNTLSVAIKGVNAGALLVELKDQLAASAGAACHSNDDGGGAISSVLLAMRLEESLARGTLRLFFSNRLWSFQASVSILL